MSETAAGATAQAQALALRLYQAVAVLSLVAIGGLSYYAFRLGPLVGDGVEESFGIAAALLFLAGALIVHVADRTYRVWPTGRRIVPPTPGVVTDRALATFLKVLVVLAIGGAIAYVLATLIA